MLLTQHPLLRFLLLSYTKAAVKNYELRKISYITLMELTKF